MLKLDPLDKLPPLPSLPSLPPLELENLSDKIEIIEPTINPIIYGNEINEKNNYKIRDFLNNDLIETIFDKDVIGKSSDDMSISSDNSEHYKKIEIYCDSDDSDDESMPDLISLQEEDSDDNVSHYQDTVIDLYDPINTNHDTNEIESLSYSDQSDNNNFNYDDYYNNLDDLEYYNNLSNAFKVPDIPTPAPTPIVSDTREVDSPIKEIITNLIDNTIEFTPPKITVIHETKLESEEEKTDDEDDSLSDINDENDKNQENVVCEITHKYDNYWKDWIKRLTLNKKNKKATIIQNNWILYTKQKNNKRAFIIQETWKTYNKRKNASNTIKRYLRNYLEKVKNDPDSFVVIDTEDLFSC